MMFAASNYGTWLPPMFSEHGVHVDRLLDILHVFMGLLFVGWGLFFVYCLFRFRAHVGHRASHELVKGKISKYLEVGVALFEAFLLVGLSMPVWAEYKNDPPKLDARQEIRVVAQQFQWNFHYPGKDGEFGRTDASLISDSNPIGLAEAEDDPAAADDVVTNELHLPVGKPVYLRLTSMDVIHSFSIPALRVKQDVIPGMEIPIWFEVQEGATSDKLCEQMRIQVPIKKANWYKLRHQMAAVDHKDPKTGEVLLAKGQRLGFSWEAGDTLFETLAKEGVTELVLEPEYAMQVVCAQLCGNSHFKMTANIITHTSSDFTAWMASESAGAEEGFEF